MSDSEYANRLYKRKDEAVALEFHEYQPRERWIVEPRKCHQNVARYVKENPCATAVTGWYVNDRADHFAFIAHSAIKENDILLNITPMSDTVSWPYLFLPDDDPNYWEIAHEAADGTIYCIAHGRSREQIEKRRTDMLLETLELLQNQAAAKDLI